MRLLPRTRHATWLLAAAAWGAVCAAAWWIVPSVPRTVAPMDGSYAVGFTADGRWVYGVGFYAPGTRSRGGPFYIWDPQTGRRVATWHEPPRAFVPWDNQGGDHFGQHAAVLYFRKDPDGWRAHLHDLLTGEDDLLPWKDPRESCRAYLAGDARYLVFETNDPALPICW